MSEEKRSRIERRNGIEKKNEWKSWKGRKQVVKPFTITIRPSAQSCYYVPSTRKKNHNKGNVAFSLCLWLCLCVYVCVCHIDKYLGKSMNINAHAKKSTNVILSRIARLSLKTKGCQIIAEKKKNLGHVTSSIEKKGSQQRPRSFQFFLLKIIFFPKHMQTRERKMKKTTQMKQFQWIQNGSE